MAAAVPSVPELVMAWGRGWTVSRGTPPPVPVHGGFRVEVGLPGHRERHILHTYTAKRLRRLAEEQDAPGRWIKITGTRETARGLLPPHWTIDSAGYLMTATFTAGRVDPPPPYRLELQAEGGFARAAAVDESGEAAASAQLGIAGRFGIIDRVETAPAHRRRGLGTVLLRVLGDHAARLGAHTGLLVGTEDGRALYERLGWTSHCEVSGAFTKEDVDTTP